MKRKKLKLSLLQKSILALSTIAVGSGITVGAMYGYANNSDEVQGSLSPTNKQLFNNDYQQIYKNGELTPQLWIMDPLKTGQVASMSDDGSKFWWGTESLEEAEKNNKIVDFNTFFNEYYDQYKESFILEVRYGSFKFINEYVVAVKPKQFVEFTKWFITNVAWGPDLLTLDNFRIVPGVEHNGDAITLGNHSTLHKEFSEIKFFPDAFFGSAPIWSGIRGAGNAQDSLSIDIFTDKQPKEYVDKYLSNIAIATALKNATLLGDNRYDASIGETSPFNAIVFPGKLKNQKVKGFIAKANKDSQNKYGSFETNLIVPEDITSEQFEELKAKYAQYSDHFKNLTFDKLQTYTIVQAGATKNANTNITQLTLKVMPEGENLDLEDAPSFVLDKNASSPWQIDAEELLAAMVQKTFVNFLDFFDANEYINNKVFLYEDTSRHIEKFFSSRLEAKTKIAQFDEEKLIEYKIKKFEVNNKVLYVTAENISTNNKGYKSERIFAFDANRIDPESLPKNKGKSVSELNKLKDQFEIFNNFKYAIGYKAAIVPRTISAGPEEFGLKNSKGEELKGLDSRKYQIYVDAYDGLIDAVLEKYPFLKTTATGPHLVKKINEQGIYEYTIEDGEYTGITPDTRIGVPLILDTTIENYEGISTDFLKYVGAHEYGHHYTLEKGQALDDKDSAVLVGGINVRSGVIDSSYYSFTALNNYLEARTNLKARRVDALGNPSDRGTFIQFGYYENKDLNDSKLVDLGWETYDEIWGSKSKDIFYTLKNKKRRFIQDFDGMEEAARLRKVRLGDLFIANSFDTPSGTLNPFITGEGKVLQTVQTKDGKNVQEYKDITAEKLIQEFKDGLGNPIQLDNYFGDTGQNSDLQRTVKLFEYTWDKDKKALTITKHLMFKADGTPVIDLELNKPITGSDLTYLNNQVTEITNNIFRLFNTHYYESGWNNGQSSIDGDKKILAESISPETISGTPSLFFDGLANKKAEDALDPTKNGYSAGQSGQQYEPGRKYSVRYVTQNDNNLFRGLNQLLVSSFGGSAKGNGFTGGIGTFYNVGALFTFISSDQQAQELSSYFAPTISTSPFVKNDQIFGRVGFDLSDLLPNVGTNNNLTPGVPQDLPTLIMQASGFATGTGRNVNLNSNQPDYSSASTSIFVGDKNKEALSSFRAFTGNLNEDTSPKWIGYNFFSSSIDNKATNQLYGAFKDDVVQDMTYKDITKSGPAFNSLNEFVDYASIDFTKATKVIQENNVLFNWDIEYVKTKFNLDKFKASLEENEKDNIDLVDLIKDEQSLTNEVMRRFRLSPLFMFVKDFKANELNKSEAIFSDKYGILQENKPISNSFIFDEKFRKTQRNFTVEQFKKIIEKSIDDLAQTQYPDEKTSESTGEVNKVRVEMVQKAKDNLSLFDIYNGLLGYHYRVYSWQNPLQLETIVRDVFTDGEPSADANNYFKTKTESLLGDKFTDYIYSLPETLTRDFVQATYVTGKQDFGNLPKYLTNVNETNTGLNFIVDATALQVWNDRLTSKETIINNAEKVFLLPANGTKLDQARLEVFNKYDQKIQNLQEQLSKWNSEYKILKEQNSNFTSDFYEAKISSLEAELKLEMVNQANDYQKALDSQILAFDSNNFSSPRITLESSYFGKFNTQNNGYFKDRWQKEEIGMQLYDSTTGLELEDKQIRTVDFNGEKVTSRPKAFFISQLKNYGVGSRTLSGVFRNKELDAVALYGFVPVEFASKIKKLVFTDVNDKSEKYELPVRIQDNILEFVNKRALIAEKQKQIANLNNQLSNSQISQNEYNKESKVLSDEINALKTELNSFLKWNNNIFYLTDQKDGNSKHFVEDEGYTSWISDYALMGKYRDALLKPGHKYTIDFADEDGNIILTKEQKIVVDEEKTKAQNDGHTYYKKEVSDKDVSLFNLGPVSSISENGKENSQAPIKVTREYSEYENNELVVKENKATIEIQNQFNVNN